MAETVAVCRGVRRRVTASHTGEAKSVQLRARWQDDGDGERHRHQDYIYGNGGWIQGGDGGQRGTAKGGRDSGMM